METNTPTTTAQQTPLNFKQWALYIFLAGLPLIGIILLFVWAFGNDANIQRREWAKGMLLIALIGLILAILFFVIFGIGMFALVNN